jgi:carbonic anhydrase/acetyltransferase-like protein (isoleucine patch superfamily)
MAHIIPYGGKTPRIHPSVFVAPTAVIIGDVEIGEESSIWFGAVLRGDDPEHGIRIGRRVSVQDNCVLHVSHRGPTIVDDEATIGHGAAFESVRVERAALIGMNSVLLHGAVIGAGALVAALSVVPEGMQVPARMLAAGAPAKIRTELSPMANDWIERSGRHYAELSRSYLAQGIGRLER